MTRYEFIERLARQFPTLTEDDVAASVSIILGGIEATLAVGHRAEIRGFGTFQLNYRPPRRGRNPKTGEAVEVPMRFIPHFKLAKSCENAST